MMAEKEGMLYMPRLLTVMLPDYASTRPPIAHRVLLGQPACPLALADQPFICWFRLTRPVLSTSRSSGVISRRRWTPPR